MSDFVSLSVAKKELKGAITFKVISLGELKSGTSKTGETYQKMVVVIKDNSGAMNVTLWNDHIGSLDVGQHYSLDNAWWSQYKNEPQLSFGNYYELNKITPEEFAVEQLENSDQTTITQSATTPGDNPESTPHVSTNVKLDEILRELELIKDMVEPLFKKMVNEQLRENTENQVEVKVDE